MTADGRDITDILYHGEAAGCPFCLAYTRRTPQLGSNIILLSGIHCGMTATVAEADGDTLLVRFTDDPPGTLYRENRLHTALLAEEIFAVPDWSMPVSVEDAHAVHEAMILAFRDAILTGHPSPLKPVISSVTAAIWWRRLPLEAADVWNVLHAHGWPLEAEARSKDRYEFGLGVLRSAVGRSEVKRKRMAPLSQGRYTPKSRP